jgi:hypothetical protein
MRATLRRYSRHWLIHAIIVAIAILIGVIVAFNARPTRGATVNAATAPRERQ